MENYIKTVKNIKEEIIKSRYIIAKVANKEILFLYFKIGNIISEKVARESWGSKTIEKLSSDLQTELKGLRGFSSTNLKRMRTFFEEWQLLLNSVRFNEIGINSSSADHFKNDKSLISSTLSDELRTTFKQISPTLLDEFAEVFLTVSFSNHYEILIKTTNLNERIFYINKSAKEFWTNRNLKHQLANRLFQNQKDFQNNFEKTISNKVNKEKALASFRDNYLLDFVRISDENEEDERVLENELVSNIKKFLMTLGNDFAFIGNQYRLIVDEEEYFIDLLFFNRSLQALVAFELKTGKFKPEYLGKMNFYLSALDEYVKKEYEKPSIGIILCKEKKNKTVEFSFRDFNKSMGVATYKTSNELPPQYRNFLPNEEDLKRLM